MATTSTSALFTRSWWLSNARGTPKRLAAASADSRRLVDSAVISKSSDSDVNAGMCACAAHPRSGLAPMMPTRILLVGALLIATRPFLVNGGARSGWTPAGASGAVVGVGRFGEPHGRPGFGKRSQLLLAELV